MKNLFYTLVALLAIASCSSNTIKTDYAKTIGDYLQTDKNGNKYKFKVLDLSEHGRITVADSITFLTEEFRKDKQLIINRIKLAKKMREDLLAKEKNPRRIDEHKAGIATINHRIDSLKNLTPDNLNGYNNKNPNDILQ